MWSKASQKPPKVTPKWSLLVPKCVFGKLHLDCACVYGLHIGPCRRAPRDTPKRHPTESSTKMPSKNNFGGHLGAQGPQKCAKLSKTVDFGLPRAPQNPSKIDEKSTWEPPGTHFNDLDALLEGPGCPAVPAEPQNYTRIYGKVVQNVSDLV